jgi:putative endonuclease
MIARWFRSLFAADDAGDSLSDRGENVAAKFLRNLGYRILSRNFRTRSGEIDIIARDGKTIVLVEVTTRKGDDDVEPEAHVGIDKQRMLARAAEVYMSRYGIPPPPVRFDVIAVIWPRNSEPLIRHTIDAFGVPD